VGCGAGEKILNIQVVFTCCFTHDTCVNPSTGACCASGLQACRGNTCCPSRLPAAMAGSVVQRIEIRASVPRGRCAATKAKTASRARAVLETTSSTGSAARTAARAVRRQSAWMGASGSASTTSGCPRCPRIRSPV
jgi:predicted ATPase with chaperone activity